MTALAENLERLEEAIGRASVSYTHLDVYKRQVWPMGIMYRALTSTDDAEIRMCLRWLRDSTAATGFMHESFDKDNASSFTRSWFAWANTLLGELVLKLAKERPALLASKLD